MRTAFFCIFVIFAILGSKGESIHIGTNTFYPAFTNSSAEGSLREYCLKGETIRNWTKLFAFRQFKNLDSPKNYIARMSDDYARKFPGMTFASGGMESKNRWFVDYLVYENSNAFSKWLLPIFVNPR